MCGFIHITFCTVPVKVIGLFWSNSAAVEWCACATAPRAASANPTAMMRANSVFIVVLRGLPRLDRAAEEVGQVVLLAGVLHHHVRRGLELPRAHVHPVPGVGLRIVHGDGVLERARVDAAERVGQL